MFLIAIITGEVTYMPANASPAPLMKAGQKHNAVNRANTTVVNTDRPPWARLGMNVS